MKRLLVFILFLAVSNVYSQQTVISGRLLNSKSSEKPLTISYLEDFLINKKVNIDLNGSGDFSTAIDISNPVILTFRNDSVFFQAYISPTNNIIINADITSKAALNKTLKFKGNLSEINQLFFNVQNDLKRTAVQWNTGEKIPAVDIAKKIEDYYNLRQTLINTSIDKNKLAAEPLKILKIDSVTDEYKKAEAILTLINNADLVKDQARKFLDNHLKPEIFIQPGTDKIHIPAVTSFWDYTYPAYLTDRDAELVEDFYNGSNRQSKMIARVYTTYQHPIKDYAIASILSDFLIYPSLSWKYSTDSLLKFSNSFLAKAQIPLKTKQYLMEYVQSLPGRVYESKKGKPAPPIFANDVNGNPVSLSEFKDKVVFIDVWATWCAPCIAQFPNVNKLKAEFKNKDIVFLMLSIDDKYEDWKSFLNKHSFEDALQLHTLNGFKGDFAKGYDVLYIPRYIIVKNSIILSYGTLQPDDPKMIQELNNYLTQGNDK